MDRFERPFDRIAEDPQGVAGWQERAGRAIGAGHADRIAEELVAQVADRRHRRLIREFGRPHIAIEIEPRIFGRSGSRARAPCQNSQNESVNSHDRQLATKWNSAHQLSPSSYPEPRPRGHTCGPLATSKSVRCFCATK